MVEMTAFYDYLFGLLGSVLTAAAVYGVRKLAKRVDWLDAGDASDTVEVYIDKGIRVVRGWLGEEIDVSDREAVNQVVQWVLDHAPEAMQAAGLNAADVEALVREYLNDVAGDQ